MSYDKVLRLTRRIHTLDTLTELLDWDSQVAMAKGSGKIRGEQMGLVSALKHEILVSKKLRKALKRAEKKDLDKYQEADLRELRRLIDKEINIPSSLVEETARLAPESHEAWAEARRTSDFQTFMPYLKKMIELKKRIAEAVDDRKNPYEILIQDFEPGAEVENLRKQFSLLRKKVVPLLSAIVSTGIIPDKSFIGKNYGTDKQDKLNQILAKTLGFDLNRGRLDGKADRSFHPMTVGGSPYDVRITTRYSYDSPLEGISGTIHEAGHGIYEQGIGSEIALTPIGMARSMGVHESQSRLWENNVGLSLPFWQFFFPIMQSEFPEQFKDYDVDSFYRVVNEVKPDLVRVEANEVTYNLHVMLRFEIEDQIFKGELDVKDLPEAWNAKMKEYLGATPKNDAEGVLQDVHWSEGLFGYFPTYALGTMWAAQIFKAAADSIPYLDEHISNGNFSELKGWLNEHIHRHGSLYLTSDLIEQATGKPPGAEDFIAYIQDKYRYLYQLGN